ncbi:AraC family transcriptional regulator [Rubellicoccus peritrichatus]|uniref:AraC family transcriptional regulator n=1 Tax=Rubellicoccus peritrichatus TaxID=3080537 RepID=A0AAQ3QXF8_9BACT|nr:AraC family transcriptional regulator [Puniceicoccus sp. CR14]WOO43638.1 AraC family transcriptional regulator [Puniceicoccus sp. CR14]
MDGISPTTSQRVAQLSLIHPILYWAYQGELPDWAERFIFDNQTSAAWRLDSGEVELEFGADREHYVAPCWIFPRRQMGRQQFSPNARLLSIRFNLYWPGERVVYPQEVSHQFPIDRFPKFNKRSEALVEFAKTIPGDQLVISMRESDLASVVNLQIHIWQWVAEYLALLNELRVELYPGSALDSRVTRALEYIQKVSLSERVTEKDIAANCGLSLSQMNRLFQQQVGHSPIRVLESRRMQAAHTALLYSTQSIKALAYELGFSSPQHFSLWFRKKQKVSPREYRMSH